MIGLAREHLERLYAVIAFGRSGVAGQGVQPLRRKRLRIQLAATAGRAEPGRIAKRQKLAAFIAWQVERQHALSLQAIERDACMPWVRCVERLRDQLALRVAEAWLGETHALREPAEEPHVAARLAERLHRAR